jgi:hypothetical protein
MLISSLTDTGFISEDVIVGHDEFFNSNFAIQYNGHATSFNVLELEYFNTLKDFCTADSFDQVIRDRQFDFQPQYRRLNFDTYLGRLDATIQYGIKNDYLIIVSGQEKQPGIYSIRVEGVWKITSMLNGKTTENYGMDDPGKKTIIIEPVEYIRHCTKSAFLATIPDFKWGANKAFADEAWTCFKTEQWQKMEHLFKSNKLNVFNESVLPPNKGFSSTVKLSVPPGHVFCSFGEKYRLYGNFEGNYMIPCEDEFLFNMDGTAVLKKYQVLKKITNVLTGPSIPWGGNPTQTFYYLPVTIRNLKNLEMIAEVL